MGKNCTKILSCRSLYFNDGKNFRSCVVVVNCQYCMFTQILRQPAIVLRRCTCAIGPRTCFTPRGCPSSSEKWHLKVSTYCIFVPPKLIVPGLHHRVSWNLKAGFLLFLSHGECAKDWINNYKIFYDFVLVYCCIVHTLDSYTRWCKDAFTQRWHNARLRDQFILDDDSHHHVHDWFEGCINFL